MTLQSAAAPSFTSPPPNAQFNDTHEPIQSHFHPILFQQTTMAPLSILAAVAFAAMIHRLRRRRTLPLPPGSVGPLPLVGETLRLIAAYKTENPEPFIDDRVRRHGRVFTSHVFGERTVFSADPEFNRLVLGGEGRGGALRCSYPSSIATLLGPHSLLLTPVGPHHRRMHALVLASFASPAALRGSPELLADVDAMVRRTVGGWGEGEVVRLLEQAKKFTFELTVKQLMSEDPGEWTEGLRREYLLVIDGFFSVPFPSFIPFTTYNRSIKARKKVAEALRWMVRRRKDEEPTAERIRRRKDMVSELLEANVAEEEMVDFLVALLVAGYETTSTIITLAVKFLTDAPPALQLLQKEHEEIKARKEEMETLDWSDYKSMPFTQCVINETLRVANVISGVFRRAEADIHFKGYTIPKGCRVFASFRAVHLDPDHYKDARTFNPWRWQEKDAPLQNAGGGGGIFTPFGGGPRLCPGYELARLEISFFLHYLVTRFRWDVAEQDRLVFFPTTRTLKGYPIRVRRSHCTAL